MPDPQTDTARNSDLATLWQAVCEDLRGRVSPSAYESWLEPLRAVGVQGERLYVDGPERVREWFDRRYGAMATATLQRHAPAIREIVFAEPPAAALSDSVTGAALGGSSVPAGLGADLDFDRFVIGHGNRFAHSAALAVAELPGEAYNPLFIYGDPGLGKTHLLVSIANYLGRQRPDMTVVYTTAERFTSEFVNSLRGKGSGAERFKARYRSVGALLIDDVQFLENKPRTEDEFFHTFNELYSAGSQIVLSSDRPPEAMERLTERLRDRFAWGLTVRVDSADPPTRMALLRRLAAERGVAIPDQEVLRQIAESVPGNLRRLEGALTRVSALASMLGRAPSADLVRQALALDRSAAGKPAPEPETLEISEIQRATCEVLHVSSADLLSPRRAPQLVRARQLAMFVARSNTDRSLAEIARAFGRDHSTVLHSIRTIERRLEPGSDLHRALEAIHERLHIADKSA
jgi:chromosomal replication initiator protein